jgi:hypothetical protein
LRDWTVSKVAGFLRKAGVIVNVGNISAICAIIIAVLSLAISVLEARATREHNRKSVKPVLQLVRIKTHGNSWAGLWLTNAGLGPAVIVDTSVELDGKIVGKWNRETFGLLVNPSSSPIPHFRSLLNDAVVPAGGDLRLIFINDFDEERDGWFWNLIASRLGFEIRYESIYGGEGLGEAIQPEEVLAQAREVRELSPKDPQS